MAFEVIYGYDVLPSRGAVRRRRRLQPSSVRSSFFAI